MSSRIQTYAFTAFSATALLAAGDASLGRSQSFPMPGGASLTVSVHDGDRSLSGDTFQDESADDKSSRTASITNALPEELGSGRRIQAESYHRVSDQNGDWDLLIEIEQEGVSGCRRNYFTFNSGGSTPFRRRRGDDGPRLTRCPWRLGQIRRPGQWRDRADGAGIWPDPRTILLRSGSGCARMEW